MEYGNVFAAKHLRESGRLPFGKYRICLKIIPTSIDFDGDEFCDILEVESITNLNLQYPIDEDMVYTTTPVLLWNHDALFGDNSGPCSYRLIIVEKEHGQSADVAIRANTPIWINENLKSHMIPFPVMHPKPLQYGHSYAWKVMELCEGKVLNESETWYFTIHKDTLPEAIKYAELSSKEDLGFYYAKGSKVYFKFNDRYSANSPLTYFVKSGSQKVYDFEIGEEGKDKINYLKKGEGDNRYELNLENSGLNAGIYTLVVRDESNELFYLKFVIE